MSRATWLDPSWRAAAEAWTTDRLAERDLTLDGPIEQPHVAPWATVLRVPTDQGPFWFKASASGTAYEHRMFAVLSEVVPDHVLTPLATEIDDGIGRAWSLLPDAGTRLRDHLESHPEERFTRWEEVVREHAHLQRALVPSVDRLLALGVPDMRPLAVPRHAAAVIEWLDLSDDLAARAHDWIPRFADACASLAESAVPSTVQQDDLHDGNVLLHGTTYRLVDWGDASISHPFGVFLILRIALARQAEVDPLGPELTRLRDVYLEEFTDLAPRAELERDLERAAYVQGVARLCSWQRALADATAEEGHEWASQLPGYLAELTTEVPPP